MGVDIGMWVRICVCMYMCVGVTGREENKNNIRIVLEQKKQVWYDIYIYNLHTVTGPPTAM